MILSHKIKLYPKNKQITYFKKACGIKRFAYNWALEESKRYYKETGKSLSRYDLSKRLNAIKKQKFPWMMEVSKWVVQKGVYDFHDALKNFWSKRSEFPKRKKKGKARDSFYIDGHNIKIDNNYLKIPKLPKIKMSQRLRFLGRLVCCVISREADQWFASISVDLEDAWVYPHKCESQACVGMDLGVRRIVTLSTGELTEVTSNLNMYQRKLRRAHRSLSRKEKGSRNRIKAKIHLSKVYLRIKRIKRDFQHKLTTYLIKNFRFIGIEDLNVSGLLKNKRVSRGIHENAFYEFRRQLEYKAKLSDSILVLANRFYPSSKTCSNCGNVDSDFVLGMETYKCKICGFICDRDLNAAYNLQELAARHAESVNACGGGSAGDSHKTIVKLPLLKQESSNSHLLLTSEMKV